MAGEHCDQEGEPGSGGGIDGGLPEENIPVAQTHTAAHTVSPTVLPTVLPTVASFYRARCAILLLVLHPFFVTFFTLCNRSTYHSVWPMKKTPRMFYSNVNLVLILVLEYYIYEKLLPVNSHSHTRAVHTPSHPQIHIRTSPTW